jgi:hypothetical protein
VRASRRGGTSAVKVGNEWLWFQSRLAGQRNTLCDMKGKEDAFDQFDYYSGCCWSDPLGD